MRTIIIRLSVALLLLTLTFSVFAADDAPANLAAPLTLKVLALENKIAAAGDISIYVLGSDALVGEFKKGVGQAVGGSKLASVSGGSALPDAAPSVLFIADPSMADAAIVFARDKKILSATNKVDLVSKGVTLGIGIAGGSPTILLNLSASVAEGLNWEPAIMNIAKTVE